MIQSLFTGSEIGQAALQDGRLLSSPVALAAFFGRRFSDPISYEKSFDSLVYKSQRDFPCLQNREMVRFYSGDHYLTGYIYRTSLSKGLILFVHGINGQADDAYAIGQAALLEAGYDVFAIDLSASGRSDGMGIKGLHQGAYDVKAAVDFIQTRNDLKNLPLYLFGHSWGAYSCLASTNLTSKPKKVVAISGFVSPIEEMIALPGSKIGFDLSATRGDLERSMEMRAGPDYDLSAATGIAKNPQIQYFIIHGAKDSVVPLSASAFEAAKHYPNVHTRLCEDRGHADILFSLASKEYVAHIKKGKDQVIKEYGKDITAYPEDLLAGIKANIDKGRASEINAELFEEIDAFLQA